MPTVKTYSSAWRQQRVKIQAEQEKRQAESEARLAATTKRGTPKDTYTQIETRTTAEGKTIKVAVSAKQKKHKIYVAYKTPSGQINVRTQYVSTPLDEAGAYTTKGDQLVGISTSVKAAKSELRSHQHRVKIYEREQAKYEQEQIEYEQALVRQREAEKIVSTPGISSALREGLRLEAEAAKPPQPIPPPSVVVKARELEKTKVETAVKKQAAPSAVKKALEVEAMPPLPPLDAPVEVHIKQADIPKGGLVTLFPDTGPLMTTKFIIEPTTSGRVPVSEVLPGAVIEGIAKELAPSTKKPVSPGEGPPPTTKEYSELVGQYGVGREYMFGTEIPRVIGEGRVEGKLIFPATPPKGPAPPPDYSALTPTPRQQFVEGDVPKVREYKFGEGPTTGVLTIISAEKEWKIGEGAGMRSIIQGPSVSPEHQARAIMGGWTDTYTETTKPSEVAPLPPMTVSKDTLTGQILGVAEDLRAGMWTHRAIALGGEPIHHAAGVGYSIGASAVEAGAGLVGAFESLGDIFGRPNIPDLPGTALTATAEGYRGMASYGQREYFGGKVLVGSGAEDIFPYVVSQEPRREAEFFIRHPTYGVGAVVGEYLLGAGIGKLVQAAAWRLGFGAKLSRAMPQTKALFEPTDVRSTTTAISTPLTKTERAVHAYRRANPSLAEAIEHPLPATQTISRARRISVSGKVRSVSEVEYEKLLQTRQTSITTIGPEEVLVRTPAGELRTVAIAKVRTPVSKIMESVRTGRYGYKFEPIRSSIRESKVLAEADFYRNIAISDIERISSEAPTITSTGRIGEFADVRVAALGGKTRAGSLAVSTQTGRRTFGLREISHEQIKGTLTDPFNVKVTTGGKVEAIKPPKVEAVKPDVVMQPPKKVGPRLPKREGDPFALDKAEVRLDSRTSGITREEIVKAEQEAAGFQLEGHIHRQVAVAETVPVGVARMQRLPLPYSVATGYTSLGLGGAGLVKSMAASSGVLISPWDAKRMGAPLAVAPSYMISEAATKKRRRRTQQVLVTKTVQEKDVDQKQIELARLKKSMLMTPALKYAMDYTFGPVTISQPMQEARLTTRLRQGLAVKPQTMQRERAKVSTITAQKVGISAPKLVSLQAQKARAAETAKLKDLTIQRRLQVLAQPSATRLKTDTSLKSRLKQASLGKTITKTKLGALTKTLTGPKTISKTKVGAETRLGVKTVSKLKEGLALKTGLRTTPAQKVVTITTPTQAQVTDVDQMQKLKQVTKEKTEAKQKLKGKLTGVSTSTTGKGGLFPGGVGILPALSKRMRGGRRGEEYFERLHAVRGPRDVLIGTKRRGRKRAR